MAPSPARTSRTSTASSLDRAAAKSRKAPEKADTKTKKAKTKASVPKAVKAEKVKKASKVEPTVEKLEKSGKSERTAKATKAVKVEVEAKAEVKPAPKVPPRRPTAPTVPVPPKPAPIISRGYVPLVDIPKPPPPPSDFQLSVGDKAVHPSNGLVEVTAIEHREIGGMKGEFYIFSFVDGTRVNRVMIPRSSVAASGIRPVMSSKDADKVLETMRAREVAVDLQPWSRRFRAYTEMINSGQPQEVAKVLRDMYRLKFDKDLSFGERRLLDKAKSLLMKELASAKGVTEAELQAQVDDMFRA